MFVSSVTDETFEAEVLNSQTPVLVDFWAGWCPPCKAMAPVLEKFAESQADRMKVVKIDADQNPVMSEKYRILNLPTMMLFQNGLPIGSFIGYMSGAELQHRVDAQLGSDQ